jgi:hypothetical protein
MNIPPTLLTQLIKLLYQFYYESTDLGDIKARERKRKAEILIKKLEKLK